MSRQKTLIYDIVASKMSHPTADWVYEQARLEMPTSIGMVYRNLKQLTAEGLLVEINTTRGASRYDSNCRSIPIYAVQSAIVLKT